MDKKLFHAFVKVKGQLDGISRVNLIQCLDLDSSWAFTFSNQPFTKDIIFMGVVYDIVNKKTGKISNKAFIEDPEKFLNAKKLDLKQFQGL